jgi:6-phosphofructokinase
VNAVYNKLGRCVIAVSEGIADSKGVPIAAKFSKEVDSHGNVQLSGTGALGDLLAGEIKKRTKIKRVRADTFGYLQRSFAGLVSEVDASEARKAGAAAVRAAVKSNKDGSIAIKRQPGKKYSVTFKRVPLKNVAKETRKMPAKFINKAGNNVTEAFLNYAKPIVGKLPETARFKALS